MLVRTDKTKDFNFVLVVDENDVYKGTIHLGTFFKFCVLEEETTSLEDYDYYTVSKKMLEKYYSK